VRQEALAMAAKAAERLQYCAVSYAGAHLAAPVSPSELADASVLACAEYAQRVQDSTEITDPYSGVQARKDAERAANDAVLRFVAGTAVPPTEPPHKGQTDT
jgi:hypothetical protein